MSEIIDGKLIAQNLRADLKEEIKILKEKYNKVPGLAVVQIGNVAASSVYVKAKTKSAQEVGIEVIDHHLENTTSQEELINLINKLNNQENVNGILVQLPLPNHMNEQIILDTIHPDKDADGFHPLNVGKYFLTKFRLGSHKRYIASIIVYTKRLLVFIILKFINQVAIM